MEYIDKMTNTSEAKFSILIPTWNNLSYLKLCIESIRKNSSFKHQIIIHINEGIDGTLDWVKKEGIEYTQSTENIGICWALNGLRPLVNTDYIVYMNDDMYVCPEWDLALWEEVEKLPTNKFFISSTLLQPRKFWCKSVISPANFGESIPDFNETDLLNEYKSFKHYDWNGATWPPNIVHRDIWDLVGGYSIEFSPGMYSDPDFSAKLWMAGVRIFKGVDRSRVYHFEARSTKRVIKNSGSSQFLLKWGITSSSFMNNILQRGVPFGSQDNALNIKVKLKKDIVRSKIKKLFVIYSKKIMPNNLWD